MMQNPQVDRHLWWVVDNHSLAKMVDSSLKAAEVAALRIRREDQWATVMLAAMAVVHMKV